MIKDLYLSMEGREVELVDTISLGMHEESRGGCSVGGEKCVTQLKRSFHSTRGCLSKVQFLSMLMLIEEVPAVTM